ncbi:MAG: glycosyltransferase [Acidimicrobiia bacterium]|nr:glycosyltransferase [Acidimicrobiia bacterium]
MIGPSFAHLLALSNRIGIYEHAEYTTPRPEHGCCTDDVARLLIVITRQPEPSPAVWDLGRTALRFLEESQGGDGRIRNRRTANGRWQGDRTVADCWGRSIWAFGTASRLAPEARMRQHCLSLFDIGIQQRSPWSRSMAFAALGAAEVLSAEPGHVGARLLLADAVTSIGRPAPDTSWSWPETRLHYANAAFPEVLVAAGHVLARLDVLEDGLTMLRWLLDRETLDGHLSVTPVDGAGPGDHAPAFDQQPIEVAAMADACDRAFVATGDTVWLNGVHLAAQWFDGHNDAGATMWDVASGGGYDGLHAWGPNMNQGAESTIALVSTLQHARRLSSVR